MTHCFGAREIISKLGFLVFVAAPSSIICILSIGNCFQKLSLEKTEVPKTFDNFLQTENLAIAPENKVTAFLIEVGEY